VWMVAASGWPATAGRVSCSQSSPPSRLGLTGRLDPMPLPTVTLMHPTLVPRPIQHEGWVYDHTHRKLGRRAML